MTAPISIIIPAFNQLHYCQQCVYSITMNTEPPYRLILVDNGSTDGVSEFFDSVPGAEVIHTGKNLGFAGGVNQGLKRAEGHALLLNSDTLVPPGWLLRLEDALNSSPDIGITGPMTNYAAGYQCIQNLEFSSLESIAAYSEERYQKYCGKRHDVSRLIGFCMLIRDSALKTVGLFDESFGIGNYEDDDYCVRTALAGFRLCVAEDCFVFHYGHRTFLGMGMIDAPWQSLMKDNEKKFLSKWQLNPEERNDPIEQSRQWNQQARQALEAGDSLAAVRLLKQAITTAPQYERNYNDLGVLLWQAGEHHDAYALFERALRFQPQYEEARDNLVQAADALGKRNEAQAFLNMLGKRMNP